MMARRIAMGVARGRMHLAIAIVALVLAIAAASALAFPPLSGRIVDQANIIPDEIRSSIEAKLVDLEAMSGIQLVVATVTSLDNQEIEPYANELFRHWQLGERTKNNGVLFLVAPNERRVRIEVGYGLEGTLTDALGKIIISNAVSPRFKAGDFGGGISRGVDDIITVLTTDASEWQKRPSVRLDSDESSDPLNWLAITLLIFFILLFIVSPGFRLLILSSLASGSGGASTRRGDWSGSGSGSGSRGGGGWSGGGGYSGGSSSGGGFSGGGGSSGGGGASGSW